MLMVMNKVCDEKVEGKKVIKIQNMKLVKLKIKKLRICERKLPLQPSRMSLAIQELRAKTHTSLSI